MRRLRLTALTVLLLLVGGLLSPAQAADRDDAVHTEAYFPAGDGLNTLHADLLRPAGIPEDQRTPVILTVSPYTNHSGEPLELGLDNEGPSDRFYDFLDLTSVLDRGYTYVMVDLPGFGGSSGCNDWGGNREQGAVVAAVEWAASQPWSNGRVGMLGKSYDAWTGLMGVAREPRGLEAVVAMEPVFAGYNYLYNNGVRFSSSVLTPALFQAIDATPGSVNDTPQYHANGAPQAWCYGVNQGLQQIDDPHDPFWQERDLLPPSRGSSVPLFLTQGYLESNTKPDAAFDFWNGLDDSGDNRAWFGQFNHVRGWETESRTGRPQTGRDPQVFLDQVLDFYDEHLLGKQTSRGGLEVQDNLGRYRLETQWPPADSEPFRSDLRIGTYTDDARNTATGGDAGDGVWSISQPLARDTWLSGEPVLRLRAESVVPRANLTALVYDIAPDGTATVVSRGARLLRGVGEQYAALRLYGQDWVLRRGHRLGVLLTGSDSDWWVHVPTASPVTVTEAEIAVPFLTRRRHRFLDGGSTPELEGHLADTVTLDAATVQEAHQEFAVPR